jgi:hypothetical protein
MHRENEDIDAWQQQEVLEEVLEPELEIVDPVSAHTVGPVMPPVLGASTELTKHLVRWCSTITSGTGASHTCPAPILALISIGIQT